MTGATASATPAATARKPVGFRGGAVRGAVTRAENRELYGVAPARALRTGNLLLLVQHNFLEMRLAILTNVFVNGHSKSIALLKLTVFSAGGCD